MRRSHAILWCAALVTSCRAQVQPGPLVVWSFAEGAQSGLFTNVAAGFSSALALRIDGAVISWGYPDLPSLPPGQSVIGLSVGFDHNCILRSDGTVYCWGYNGFGQCNPPPGRFTKISAGERFNVAIREDGTLAAWGAGHAPPAGAYKDVWCGKDWNLAQRLDGTLVAWGFNQFGVVSGVPTYPVLTASAAPEYLGMAVRLDGSIVHWGCGCEVNTNIPAGPFVAVFAGANSAVALRADGTAVGWGGNIAGQAIAPPARFRMLDKGIGLGIGIAACYANCDGSTAPPFLNINDFVCFLNYFAGGGAGEQYANCDASTTPPVLNVNDFVCFLNRFSAGCTAP
ncbi:MAG: hypothetical protein JNM80_14095 [Phycisphaerae bacterium]|nr:hypothetical protein [Phycisphaerae bacterium]